jgi:hypothetical protein
MEFNSPVNSPFHRLRRNIIRVEASLRGHFDLVRNKYFFFFLIRRPSAGIRELKDSFHKHP